VLREKRDKGGKLLLMVQNRRIQGLLAKEHIEILFWAHPNSFLQTKRESFLSRIFKIKGFTNSENFCHF